MTPERKLVFKASLIAMSSLMFFTPIGVFSMFKLSKLQRFQKVGNDIEVEKCYRRIKINGWIVLGLYLVIIIFGVLCQ